MQSTLLDSLGVPRRYRSTVATHSAAWTLFGLFAGGATQQLGFIIRTIGGSPVLVAVVTSGPYAFALFSMLYAPMLERFRAGSIVASSRFVCAALLLAVPLRPTALSLTLLGLAALVSVRVGETFYGRLLAELYPGELRGRLQSLPLFAQALALTAASLAAGWVLRSSEAAYRWLLPLLAPAGMAAALLVSRLGRGTPRSEGGSRGGAARAGRAAFAEVVRDRPFLLWTLVYSVTTVGFWLVQSSLPVYFASVLHLGYWENGVVLAAFNGLYCVGFLLWGRILDRVKSLPTMMLSWTFTGLGVLIIALGGKLGAALAGQALAGLALAGNDIAWYPVVLEFAPAHRVDRYMGVYMTAVGARALVGGGAGALLMSASADGSRTALLAASAFMLVGSLAMLPLRRAPPGSPPPPTAPP